MVEIFLRVILQSRARFNRVVYANRAPMGLLLCLQTRLMSAFKQWSFILPRPPSGKEEILPFPSPPSSNERVLLQFQKHCMKRWGSRLKSYSSKILSLSTKDTPLSYKLKFCSPTEISYGKQLARSVIYQYHYIIYIKFTGEGPSAMLSISRLIIIVRQEFDVGVSFVTNLAYLIKRTTYLYKCTILSILLSWVRIPPKRLNLGLAILNKSKFGRTKVPSPWVAILLCEGKCL